MGKSCSGWQEWKDILPESMVVNTATGFSRNYGNYPYGNYRSAHGSLLFPVSPDDNRLQRKTRGLGILINGAAKFYPLPGFSEAVVVSKHDIFHTCFDPTCLCCYTAYFFNKFDIQI